MIPNDTHQPASSALPHELIIWNLYHLIPASESAHPFMKLLIFVKHISKMCDPPVAAPVWIAMLPVAAAALLYVQHA